MEITLNIKPDRLTGREDVEPLEDRLADITPWLSKRIGKEVTPSLRIGTKNKIIKAVFR